MFNSIIASYGVIAAAFIILGVGLVLGLLLSLVYMFNKRKESLSFRFPFNSGDDATSGSDGFILHQWQSRRLDYDCWGFCFDTV